MINYNGIFFFCMNYLIIFNRREYFDSFSLSFEIDILELVHILIIE